MQFVELRRIFPKSKLSGFSIPKYVESGRSPDNYLDLAGLAYQKHAKYKHLPANQVWIFDSSENKRNGYSGLAMLDLKFDSLFQTSRLPVLIIAHRGTDDMKDVLGADLSLLRRRLPEQAESARLFDINARLQLGVDENYPTIHVGHSLGAALAQILAFPKGHVAVGFETPGTRDILKHLQTPQSSQAKMYSFNMHGSYVSETMPQADSHLVKCLSTEIEPLGDINPVGNVRKYHFREKIDRCFSEHQREIWQTPF